MPETLPVKPSDLVIDEQNPRILEPNGGQHKAQKELAKMLGKKLTVLAADILHHGLNPSDLSIVMPQPGSPGRYIVLEGNRRLVALRALENPEMLADAVTPATLRQLRKLSRTYQDSPIDSVPCSVFSNRDEARHWIELRHTGENSGAGIVPWGSDESARFRARAGNPEPHLQALDFLQRQGALSVELRQQLPASSFKRLIDTPYVRSKLGLEVQQGNLSLVAPEKKVVAALMHVVSDLASGKTKVGAIYHKRDREEYADSLPSSIVVTPTVKSGRGKPIGAFDSQKNASSRKASRTPKQRDRLIPRDCILSIAVARIQEIETELRKLSLEDHPNAVGVLFRVFIELCLDAYLETHTVGTLTSDSGLNKKLEGIAGDLEQRKKLNHQQAKVVRRAAQSDSFLAPSMTVLHQYVHNQHFFPAPSDLRAHWNSLQPFIAALWTP